MNIGANIDCIHFARLAYLGQIRIGSIRVISPSV